MRFAMIFDFPFSKRQLGGETAPGGRSTRRQNAGFSLVEVVMSVAIMAVGVVTLMGLLPHGIEISGKTANELAAARISQQVLGELQASTWVSLSGTAGTPIRKFYDDQGIEIERDADDFAYRLAYVAEVELPATTNDAQGMMARLPSNSAAGARQTNLRRAIIRIADKPTEDFDFLTAPKSSYRTIVHLIANIR